MARGDYPIKAAFDKINAEEGKSATSGARRILSALAAILTLAAFGIVVWYAYSAGVREGSEVAAPLLTPDGPSSFTSQDPGGREIPHRGIGVYGVIDGSAGGQAAGRRPAATAGKPVAAAGGAQASTSRQAAAGGTEARRAESTTARDHGTGKAAAGAQNGCQASVKTGVRQGVPGAGRLFAQRRCGHARMDQAGETKRRRPGRSHLVREAGHDPKKGYLFPGSDRSAAGQGRRPAGLRVAEAAENWLSCREAVSAAAVLGCAGHRPIPRGHRHADRFT